MAETKSVEQQLAEQTAQIAALKAERDGLRAAIKDDTIAKPIIGEVEIKVKDVRGKETTHKVGFKAGHVNVLVIDIEAGWNEVVASESLLALANGTASDEQLSKSKLLKTMSADDAKAYLATLVKNKYAYLTGVE